ncbi:MAG: PspC domain-containing protein [Bacteroidales bacterium]|nr:PspC domain-containing protein [Bacteroidales bacterium]
MKQTVKINLSQRLFDLDADAYDKLKDYLDSLKNYFRNTGDSVEEILQDIEQRIADVLSEKLDSKKEVVTLRDIEEVIALMGTVDDFVRDSRDEEEAPEPEKAESDSSRESFNKEHRRLYRDIDNNLIGGVCSGLGAYFNIDPVWIRLTFVLLFFFEAFGLLIYIILWVVVPGARTTAQKLQMKGRPVNVENIQNSVKNEFGKVKDKFNKFSKSESYKRTQQSVSDAFSTLGEILIVFLKVVLIIIGIGVIVFGITFLTGIITKFPTHGIFRPFHIPDLNIKENLLPLIENFTLFSFALTITILIPVIAILVGIIKLIFNVKGHNNTLSAFTWTIWALALVYVIVAFLSREDLLSNREDYLPKERLKTSIDKTLYIDFYDEMYLSENTDRYNIFGKTIIHNDFADNCYLQPSIKIKYTNDHYSCILIEESFLFPPDNDELFYNWSATDSSILLSEYFVINEKEIWKIPQLFVTIFIPDKQRLVLSDKLREVTGNSVAYLAN